MTAPLARRSRNIVLLPSPYFRCPACAGYGGRVVGHKLGDALGTQGDPRRAGGEAYLDRTRSLNPGEMPRWSAGLPHVGGHLDEVDGSSAVAQAPRFLSSRPSFL